MPVKHSRDVTRVRPGLFTREDVRMIAAHAELAADPAHELGLARTLRWSRRPAGAPGRRRNRASAGRPARSSPSTARQHGKPARPRRRIGEDAPAILGRRGHINRVVHGRHRRALYRNGGFRDYTGRVRWRRSRKRPAPGRSPKSSMASWSTPTIPSTSSREREPDAAELGDEDVPADDRAAADRRR